MQVFISHAAKDSELARQLGAKLRAGGMSVWNPRDEIYPGDNWAKKIGEALESSEAMVVLLSPDAFQTSESMRNEIEYALSSKNYEGRLVTVYVGPACESPRDVPWILQRLPFYQLTTLDEGAEQVIDEIASLQA